HLKNGRPDKARPLFEQAIEAQWRALVVTPADPKRREGMLKHLTQLFRLLHTQNDHRALAKVAHQVSRVPASDGWLVREAGRALAWCVGLALADESLTPKRRTELADGYAAEAIDALTIAMKAGDRHWQGLFEEVEARPFVQREDFQRLAQEQG